MTDSENTFKSAKSAGCIEVICGSMFSGKTEELMRRLNLALIKNLDVHIFKPQIDTRYAQHAIVSHNQKTMPCTAIPTSTEILKFKKDQQVIAIDEAQFFDRDLPHVCNTLANAGIRVVVAGLDMDFRGHPFGPIPALMAIADDVTKLQAVCVRCGKPALYSFRFTGGTTQILLGETNAYEPRCRNCYHNYSTKSHSL
ncbi:thymidine kinase [Mucilaginibacter hurinus]|uniref:Thymidine kinase n=1 Tax=Mucilaginibacter hurinus TaxID=2201324 RepID=A0A367GL59_9SPHI|nr:thymidine kinase [Mucilaginibacter hurinus]RCH54214.1 thymidine kinase [Mucilaginibacter hurinus]